MTVEIDALIDMAVAHGQIATGAKRELVAKRAGAVGARLAVVLGSAAAPNQTRASRWTDDEDAFLRANLGVQSEDEIGLALGRTASAVRLRWKRELRLPPPSKRPDILTAEHIANGLGIDGKSVHKLIDGGLLSGRRLPFNGRATRVVDRMVFLRWLIRPDSWIYFRPERVGRRRRRGKPSAE